MNGKIVFLITILIIGGCSTNRTTPQNLPTQETTPSFVVKPAETKYVVPESDKKKYVDFGLTRDKAGDPSYSFYLIKSSVTRKGDVAEVKVLANVESPKTEKGKTVLSSIIFMDFDCKSMRQSRRTITEFYSLPFGKGDKIGTANHLENGTGDWETVKPDSLNSRFLKSACYLSNKDSQSNKVPPPITTTTTNKTNPDTFLKALKEEERKIAVQKETALKLRQVNSDDRSYLSKMKSKIRTNIVLPPGIEGNPISTFRITQLPSGEIISVQILKSSGNTQLDEAVEKAIRKSSPLPIPENREPDRTIDITYLPF